jgi:hypothetical protein
MYSSSPTQSSALSGLEWLASCPSHFTPGERASISHRIGDWVDCRAGIKSQFSGWPPQSLEAVLAGIHSCLMYRIM